MSVEKNIKRAKVIVQNENKLQREERNNKIKDYIEHKMIKGYSREDATKMAKELIDEQ